MDRLIALVALRWRLGRRALFGARERLLGFLLLVPMLALGSIAASAATFFGMRALDRAHPEWVLPFLSLAATLAGVFWALSPLLAGVAFSETHDLSRLVHFPVPVRTLLFSSLLANLTEPLVLAKVPLLLALALALARGPASFLLAAAGLGLAFAFTLVATQFTGLLFLALSRNRRAQDRAMFLGLGLGFLLSLLPVLLMTGGARVVPVLLRIVVEGDVFVLSPFAWGARAAAHAGRGELVPMAAFGAAALFVFVLGIAGSASLAGRIYRGEIDLGGPAQKPGARGARMWFAGPFGALLEKDLRVTWRDPRLKALLFTGLFAPLFLIILLRGGRASPAVFLTLASVSGLGIYGANALGMERRGLLLLLAFPFPRWQVLVAKNAMAASLRLPGALVLSAATALLLSPLFAAAVLTIVAVSLLLSAGADNFVSVLFPMAVPDAGRNPHGASSGGRGLGAGVIAALLALLAMLLSSPFAFLAWLPWLLERPWLWLVTLPLAVAGAGALYAIMVAWAARLLAAREPEILARVLGEE